MRPAPRAPHVSHNIPASSRPEGLPVVCSAGRRHGSEHRAHAQIVAAATAGPSRVVAPGHPTVRAAITVAAAVTPSATTRTTMRP